MDTIEKGGTLMRQYDAIIIGTGRGLSLVRSAAAEGMKVAVVELGHPGGTCLNFGCIPSKLLISAADRLREIQEAPDFGIRAKIEDVDFNAIMKTMRDYVLKYREQRRDFLENNDQVDYYPVRGEFTEPYTLKVGEGQIKSRLIFLAPGARPAIPPLEGLNEIEYHTNETVLQLETPPGSMIIVGGGYIGVEYGHFFSAMGTRVDIIETGDRLIKKEEPEIADLLTERLSEHVGVRTNTRAVRVRGEKGKYSLVCESDGRNSEFTLTAQAIMVATGRKPNSDLLALDRTGVETDEKGFIRVDDYFETTTEGIWSFGDAIGKGMFTHAGSREAAITWANAYKGQKNMLNYLAVPHAIFTRPQIASVGLKQAEAAEGHDILVGRAEYSDTVKGAALRQRGTFAKVIAEAGSRRLLGFHIIGPYAPILIQEATNVIAAGGGVDDLTGGLHIHPAMSELITAAVRNLEKAG
jgi:dihydrolipoamide dehydrogenase